MFVDWALPDEPALDAFASGDDEVDGYFRSRRWFDLKTGRAKPPTYRFSVAPGEDVIGYATVSFSKMPHPIGDATEKALYLVVYVVGINQRWQGIAHPERPGESLAVSIFEFLRAKAAENERCVGLYLRVRVHNARAIAFYRKFGFVEDPCPPLTPAGEQPSLRVMRRTLTPRDSKAGHG